VVTTVPLELPDSPLATNVNEGLARVEDALQQSTRTDNALLADASRHLIEAGGKRFRATLVLLASHFGDSRDARVVPAAAAVELTHLATLYHDDVMDEASIRRGHESANSRWGNTIAILTGDFLFARASAILAELGVEAIKIQAETFTRLVSGQVAETLGPRPGQDPLAHYLNVVENKTASLVATAGRFGALFAGAPAGVVARIRSASRALGVAFQLSDDILDVAAESAQSGKAPGTDLREGVRSLPVLHALASPAPGGERLRELLSRDGLTDESLHAEALELLRAHPAMETAQADLRRWADTARAEVAGLPDVPARRAFEIMCDFVMERTG